jgi:hypothetical protein
MAIPKKIRNRIPTAAPAVDMVPQKAEKDTTKKLSRNVRVDEKIQFIAHRARRRSKMRFMDEDSFDTAHLDRVLVTLILREPAILVTRSEHEVHGN